MSGSGKFDRSAKNFKDGIDSLFIPEGCIQKRRRIKGTSTSTAAGREPEIDNEKFTELMLSASSSSEEEGTPVGILVSGRNVSELSPNLPCLSHGSISVIGRRRVMEDMVTVAPGVLAGYFASSYDFFAVYDGHGGSSVAQTCRERMHQLLAKEVEGWTGGGEGVRIDWEKVMVGCFSKMDDEVNRDAFRADDGFVSVMRMGSTAVVVLVGEEEIVVANCGDSRAVLYRGGNVVQLSRDHKPDSHDEKERIEAAGGRIVDWNGCRVEGVLATSRSIGDHYLKPYVISEPEVTVIERTATDYFLIIASDGLWDVVTNEVACDIVRRCFDGQMKRRFSSSGTTSSAAESAAILAELAMGRGSKDNISVIVVELKESNHNNVA